MAYIDSTAIDFTKLNLTKKDNTQTNLTKPSTDVTNSISTVVKGTDNTISAITALAAGHTTDIQKAQTAANFALSILPAGSLQSAIKSVTSTFEGGVKSLASSISPSLSNIFKDGNIASASTTTNLISDPVKTNLLSKKAPASTTFKIDSLQSGSQSVTTSGSSSSFGSGSKDMIGITLSTLLNRLEFRFYSESWIFPYQ